MERLIRLLQANCEVSAYKITSKNTHSYQLFFVDDRLETNRLVDSVSYNCVVYFDKENQRGSGSFEYAEYMSDEEVLECIKSALFNASLALNPFYELPKKNIFSKVISSNLKDMDFKDVAEKVSTAIFSSGMNEVLLSAATEIFINKIEERIINSNGLDVKQERYYGEVEMIPSYNTKEKEVEIYHVISFSNFDFEDIKRQASEALNLVKDRFSAIDLPKGLDGVNIIMDSPDTNQIFEYFTDNLTYHSKYLKNNLFEVNQRVTVDNPTGDIINISLRGDYKGCSNSSLFDNDGIEFKNVDIVKNNIAVSMFGSQQFGYYLKEKDIKGQLPIMIVEPGKSSFKEMKAKPYIRCVRFSSLQQDSTNGLIGGEVRLGYYFDGKKEIPVTGFTFTGNMHELKGNLLLSNETITTKDYHGPKYVLLPKTSIV